MEGRKGMEKGEDSNPPSRMSGYGAANVYVDFKQKPKSACIWRINHWEYWECILPHRRDLIVHTSDV